MEIIKNQKSVNSHISHIEKIKEEFKERIQYCIKDDGKIEPIKGLHLHRSSKTSKLHIVTDPGFCVVAQGSKELFIGSECYQYNPDNYLLITAELPIVSYINNATPESPFISLRIELDPKLVGAVLVGTESLSKN